MGMENISEIDFNSYEDIRQSGLTNMFDIRRVLELDKEIGCASLTVEKVKTIMIFYDKLVEKFGRGD